MTPNDFAVKHGFDFARYEGDFEGYKVYVAGTNEFACTGFPFFILEKDGEIKTLNNIDEVRAMMQYLWGSEDKEDDREE